MAPEIQAQKIPQLVTDGVKLAKTQAEVNALVQKLQSGTCWSAEEYKKVIEDSLGKIREIIH